MDNFNQDDFLTLRLGQPSSSKPSTNANSETFHWDFNGLPDVRVSHNPVPLTHQHPGGGAVLVTPNQVHPPLPAVLVQPPPAAAPVQPPPAAQVQPPPAAPVQPPPAVRVQPPPAVRVQPPPAVPVQPPLVGPSNLLTGKSEHVQPPFPWATSKRATVHSMVHLLSNQITRIGGEVQCRTCNHKYWMEFDLQEKFNEVSNYIVNNWGNFHDRAPATWTHPSLPSCRQCKQERSARPVMGEKKKSINWLFLFLGQMLGCCTLGHLRYFCKHTSNHRTGAKDRLLYIAYLELRNQLHPTNRSLANRA